MQSFDTHNTDSEQPAETQKGVVVARVADLARGRCQTVKLSAGRELALFNVNGEFYATENSCPHQGAPLGDGILCQHVVECDLHGWEFDVRTGECLTVDERIATYPVVIEDGLVKILI